MVQLRDNAGNVSLAGAGGVLSKEAAVSKVHKKCGPRTLKDAG